MKTICASSVDGPGPLRKLLGIWAEEIQVFYPDEACRFSLVPGNNLGMTGSFSGDTFADIIHAETAEVLATYDADFFAGRPAVTCNEFESGRAYYLATRPGTEFLTPFFKKIAIDLNLKTAIASPLPPGVTAQVRQGGGKRFVFILNFNRSPQTLTLHGNKSVELPPYGTLILEDSTIAIDFE